MSKKTTHIGLLTGNDRRTPKDTKFWVELRQTKNYWITEHGTKYRKRDGWGVGEYPLYSLELKTIKDKP